MDERKPTTPQLHVETFPNPSPDRDYEIRIRIPEFTCLCPKTGQPDFADLLLEYVPEERCIELKSLKLYLQRFRDQGIFYEGVVNRILDDFVAASRPRRCSQNNGRRSGSGGPVRRPDRGPTGTTDGRRSTACRASG